MDDNDLINDLEELAMKIIDPSLRDVSLPKIAANRIRELSVRVVALEERVRFLSLGSNHQG